MEKELERSRGRTQHNYDLPEDTQSRLGVEDQHTSRKMLIPIVTNIIVILRKEYGSPEDNILGISILDLKE